MIFILRLILIAASCYLLGPLLPWWSVVLCAVVISFFLLGDNFAAFLSGFVGAGLLWMVMAWRIDRVAESNISKRMVEVVGVDDPVTLIVAAGVVGGLIGGFSAFTGNSFRQMFTRKKSFYN